MVSTFLFVGILSPGPLHFAMSNSQPIPSRQDEPQYRSASIAELTPSRWSLVPDAPPSPAFDAQSDLWNEAQTDSPSKTFRPLTLNEARQLSLSLHQTLSPCRTSPKWLTSESIRLAENLHDAGLRWDKKRRVMGLHLKGIWEEGEKLNTGSGVGTDGHRAMEYGACIPPKEAEVMLTLHRRYIQGSFLSTAEAPHPLDTM